MTIATISDTLGEHKYVEMPKADVIVHAGNITSFGAGSEIESFLKWFSGLDAFLKIFIAGNHDSPFDDNYMSETWLSEMLNDYKVNTEKGSLMYLENKSVNVWGVNFYGSPNTRCNSSVHFAFAEQYSTGLNNIWSEIPLETDILITHSPAAYKLDLDKKAKTHEGDKGLRHRIKIVQPIVHICGEVQDGAGVASDVETVYINACTYNGHSPYLFDIDEETKFIGDVYQDIKSIK